VSTTRPALVSGESVVFATRKHWMAPVADSAWPIAMVLAALALGFVQPRDGSGLTGFVDRSVELIRLGLFLGGAAWIAYNVIAWRTAEYTVTNRRVIGREGLVRRHETDSLLTSITDVRTTSSFAGRALGYGGVWLTSAAGEDRLTTLRAADVFERHLQEERVRAAEQQVPAVSQGAEVQPFAPPSVVEYTEVLGELARLRDAGALTEDEYDAKKSELLERI